MISLAFISNILNVSEQFSGQCLYVYIFLALCGKSLKYIKIRLFQQFRIFIQIKFVCSFMCIIFKIIFLFGFKI